MARGSDRSDEGDVTHIDDVTHMGGVIDMRDMRDMGDVGTVDDAGGESAGGIGMRSGAQHPEYMKHIVAARRNISRLSAGRRSRLPVAPDA
jgi:hypothetical protein